MNREKNTYIPVITKLAIPIIIQNLLSSCISSMDVIMLNFVSQDAISAVSLAANVTGWLFMIYFGMGTGATMLCSQYYGKGDLEAVRVVQGIALRISIIVSMLIAAFAFFAPELLMYIFTDDAVMVEIGAVYLKYLSLAYLCWGISEVYLSVLRSIGRVKTPMVINICCFIINVFFNAVFIFGMFGAPKMGAAGVALGTTISRLFGLAGCILVSVFSKDIKLELKYVFYRNDILFKDFCKSALPATANDVVWGLAFSVYAMILGHMGSDPVAANSLVSVVRNFGTTMCFGMASAGGIVIGQVIGENRYGDAKEAAKALVRLTIITAALGALVIIGSMPVVMRFATLSETAMGYLKWMLIINIYYVFGPAVNTSLICGVFRGGGDSAYGFKVDCIDMWLYAVPLGLLNAFVFKLPVMWVYFFMCTDEFVKWPWVIGHYLKGKWIKNITRDNWESGETGRVSD